ncbi:MAG: hypothetical protein Kow0031_14360 [Anaerolineae bacterium]
MVFGLMALLLLAAALGSVWVAGSSGPVWLLWGAGVLAALLVVAGLASLLHRAIARNVRQLADTAGQIRRGRLDAAVTVTTADELADLAATINQLAQVAQANQELYDNIQAEKARSDKLLNVVIPIGVALSAEQNFDRLLEKILLEAIAFCNADAGTLYLTTSAGSLRFVLVRNHSLKLAMGGTSGQDIDFPPIALADETGQPNHSNVAAHVALTGNPINIVDAYQADGFSFSGTKAFDRQTGYRSTSFLTVPLKNGRDEVLGVLQLINALDHTGRIISFDKTLEEMVVSLSSLAAVALEAYIREQQLQRQIQQLRIEIDEVKRKRQVSEIIESDFFKQLQDRAKTIRKPEDPPPPTPPD